MNKELLKLIANSIRGINNIMDNIACGGCAVFAHALGRELQRNNIPVNIVSLGMWPSADPSGVVERIRNSGGIHSASDLHSNEVLMYHVLVEIEVEGELIYLDSYGINHIQPDDSINFHGYSLYIDGRMTLEECGIISSLEDGWNPTFDRRNIPTVYEFVNSTVNTIFNSSQLELH